MQSEAVDTALAEATEVAALLLLENLEPSRFGSIVGLLHAVHGLCEPRQFLRICRRAVLAAAPDEENRKKAG